MYVNLMSVHNDFLRTPYLSMLKRSTTRYASAPAQLFDPACAITHIQLENMDEDNAKDEGGEIGTSQLPFEHLFYR